MPGEGVHASRSLPGAHGPEDGHAGIESPLGNGEPGGIENLAGFDRVMDLADHDGRGLLFGVERPRRKRGEGGEIPSPSPEPDLPNRQENEPREHDGDEGRKVVPEHHPAVEVGGVVVHEIEQRILAQPGEGDGGQSSRVRIPARRKTGGYEE